MFFECQNITFRYPGTQNFVFQNLSFRLNEPGFNALFGPSGIGKTSLAKIILGDIENFSGDIRNNGVNTLLYSYNMERLPGWSTVGKHLDKITPMDRKPLKDELVDVFGVQKCMDSRFTQLSLGQQNRVNLIRYLVQDFQLLIMDESLANVDELTKEKIILKIKAMFPDRSFLYISHNVVEVAKFCKKILVLRSHHKDPQAVTLEGRDYKAGRALDNKALEHTMLEIVNAS